MATSTEDDNRESKKKKIDGNKDVDPQLWHAVAGITVQIPELNSNIFYFPQGHAEHAYEPVNFPADIKIPSEIPCRVAAIHYRADLDTDEVYAKLRLVPLHISEVSFDDDDVTRIDDMSETKNKYQFYTKTLTQSDINGGGLSCPRYCAETLFPPLDYSGTPPSQKIYPTDFHGETWEFKHVYRGMPKRHLLSTGWRVFVTNKLLVSGDSLVFARAENSDLHIGIQRSKRLNDFGFNPSSKSKPGNEIGIRLVPPHGELKSSSGEKDDKPQKNELSISDKVMGIGKVKAEDVIEAVKLGVNMQPFDVVYYPRVGTPEFFVKTSLIRTVLQIRWYSGMRFKMAFESEDSSKINWFMGTIASLHTADPAWPNSLWRLLQGAGRDPFCLSLSDFHINKSPLGLFKPNLQQPFDHNATTSMTVRSNAVLQKANDSENVPCSPSEKQDHANPAQIVLFGQTIRVDAGNENAVNKLTNSFSNLLQDPPKQSSGERLECDPENQCIKETLAGETSETEHSATSSKEVGGSKF